jgi:hypothetical protein
MRGGEGERSQLGPSFVAKSWGYSAFQYILPCQAQTRNESLREPLRNECLGPSGLGSPPARGAGLEIAQFPLKNLVATLQLNS